MWQAAVDLVKQRRMRALSANDSRRYRLGALIGEGSFGSVHKAKDLATLKQVAIKKAKADSGEEGENEKNRYLTLRHQNILAMLGHFMETENKVPRLCMILELMPESLDDVIEKLHAKQKAMNSESIATLTFQIFKGLNYLHVKGLLHRDVKPGNVLVDIKKGIAKISDLGSVTETDNALDTYVVTKEYRAPELALGRSPYNEKIDCWSAGCILVECFLGRPLFNAANSDVLFQKICNILGTPTAEELIAISPPNSDVAFEPHLPTLDKVLSKAKVPPGADSLLKRLITFNPANRLNALEAMATSFFDPLRAKSKKHQALFTFTTEELQRANGPLVAKILPASSNDCIRGTVQQRQQQEKSSSDKK